MEPYERLEYEFAVHLVGLGWEGDRRNVVACSSGTAALHLAFESLQIQGSNRILLPDYCMIACPRSVVLAGLTPAFVDVNDRLLLDTDSLGWASSDPYSGMLVVHNYGRREDMDWIHSVTTSHHAVIEDMAELHGVAPDERTDAACWSFYSNKLIGGEEGGAVAFKEVECADRARRLRNLGFTEEHDFFHDPRGHNYRLANLLAVPILDSLKKYPENLLLRRAAERWYDNACPDEWRMPPRDAPWVYDLRVPGLSWEIQKRVVRALNGKGIAARCGFRPMTCQEEYQRGERFAGDPMKWGISPNALRLSKEVFYLPLTPGSVTPESARLAFETIKDVVRRVQR